MNSFFRFHSINFFIIVRFLGFFLFTSTAGSNCSSEWAGETDYSGENIQPQLNSFIVINGITTLATLAMPSMFVFLFFGAYVLFRCPWFSGGPSVHTRLRRVGLSPVKVCHRRGRATFHPLYIPERPCKPTRL